MAIEDDPTLHAFVSAMASARSRGITAGTAYVTAEFAYELRAAVARESTLPAYSDPTPRPTIEVSRWDESFVGVLFNCPVYIREQPYPVTVE